MAILKLTLSNDIAKKFEFEFGCSNPGVTFHQFPHPVKNQEGFKAWVNIVGGKLETADDIKLYRKKVICDIHFANQFKNRNNRLNALAVPTLHLHETETETADAGQANYVCGWVLAKCLKNVSKSCRHCKNEINGNSQLESNKYIRAKEYVKGRHYLLYPTQDAEKAFKEIQNITLEILKNNVPKTKLKEKIKMFLDIFVDYPFTCEIHKKELKNVFENTTINVLVYSWCRSINRILSGKIQYRGEDDEIKLSAQIYFYKHKHK